MKIALVHDYLVQDGGAERVLQAFHKTWPNAPIFVLFHDKKKFTQFSNAQINQSFLKNIPFILKNYKWLLPIMPRATEQYDLTSFDVVLSSTSAFAKGVVTEPKTVHISYCHTPTRYLWTDTHDYVNNLRSNFIIKALLPKLIKKLRIWDKMSADRVDFFIANSQTVQKRIKKFYNKTSDVMYPPIDMTQYQISQDIQNYFVTGGRLVQYKRFDLVIQVFNRLQIPLKIFGDGPELKKLKKIAKPNITFLGRISDDQKAIILASAKAFIHPQVEDFGITPIESMSAGRPVIAYGEGGATETVIPNKTGVLFYEQTWASLLDTVLHFDEHKWDSNDIRLWAAQFDIVLFMCSIKKYVDDKHRSFVQATQTDLLKAFDRQD